MQPYNRLNFIFGTWKQHFPGYVFFSSGKQFQMAAILKIKVTNGVCMERTCIYIDSIYIASYFFCPLFSLGVIFIPIATHYIVEYSNL